MKSSYFGHSNWDPILNVNVERSRYWDDCLRILLVHRPRRPMEHRGMLDERAGSGIDGYQPRSSTDHRP